MYTPHGPREESRLTSDNHDIVNHRIAGAPIRRCARTAQFEQAGGMAAARSRTSPTDDSGKLREMPRMSRGGRLAASLRLKVSAPLLHSIRLSVACMVPTPVVLKHLGSVGSLCFWTGTCYFPPSDPKRCASRRSFRNRTCDFPASGSSVGVSLGTVFR